MTIALFLLALVSIGAIIIFATHRSAPVAVTDSGADEFALIPMPETGTMGFAENVQSIFSAKPAYKPVIGEKVLYKTLSGRWLVARVIGGSVDGFNLRRKGHEFRRPADQLRPRPRTLATELAA